MDQAERTRVKQNFTAWAHGKYGARPEVQAILYALENDLRMTLDGIDAPARIDTRIVTAVTRGLTEVYGHAPKHDVLYATLVHVAEQVDPEIAEEWKRKANTSHT